MFSCFSVLFFLSQFILNVLYILVVLSNLSLIYMYICFVCSLYHMDTRKVIQSIFTFLILEKSKIYPISLKSIDYLEINCEECTHFWTPQLCIHQFENISYSEVLVKNFFLGKSYSSTLQHIKYIIPIKNFANFVI